MSAGSAAMVRGTSMRSVVMVASCHRRLRRRPFEIDQLAVIETGDDPRGLVRGGRSAHGDEAMPERLRSRAPRAEPVVRVFEEVSGEVAPGRAGPANGAVGRVDERAGAGAVVEVREQSGPLVAGRDPVAE